MLLNPECFALLSMPPPSGVKIAVAVSAGASKAAEGGYATVVCTLSRLCKSVSLHCFPHTWGQLGPSLNKLPSLTDTPAPGLSTEFVRFGWRVGSSSKNIPLPRLLPAATRRELRLRDALKFRTKIPPGAMIETRGGGKSRNWLPDAL